jgi:hypothetical protein
MGFMLSRFQHRDLGHPAFFRRVPPGREHHFGLLTPGCASLPRGYYHVVSPGRSQVILLTMTVYF